MADLYKKMKLNKYVITLMIFNTLFLPVNTLLAAQGISFSEAAHLAISSNPRIRDSHANVNAAAANVTTARGEGLPTLDMEVNAARSNNPLNVFSYKLSQGNASFDDFGAGQYSGVDSLGIRPHNLNSPGYYNNYNTGIVLNVPIFTGGDAVAKTRRAQALLVAAKEGNEAAKNELIYDLLQSYAGWQTANKIVSLTQNSLNTADKYLALTNHLYQQSITLKSDVLLMQTYQRTLESKLSAAKAEALNQLDTFRNLIGKPDSSYIPGSDIHFSLSTNQHFVDNGLENNPRIKALRSEINASREALHSAESSNWPQLNLQLRHDWNADSPALNAPSNTAILALDWKLFSSGVQSGTSKQAQAILDRSSAAFDTASDNLRVTITESIRKINTTKIQIEADRQNTQALNRAVKILYSRYGQGLVPLGQLLDAQSRLDEANIQYAINQYHLLVAQAHVLMLTNQLISALDLNRDQQILA